MRLAIVATLVVLSGLLLLVPRPVAAQQQRAAVHDGFGRMVFEWDSPTTHSARVEGDQLLVTFGRPVTSNPASLVGTLSSYVRGATLSADRKTVAFSLTGPHGLHTFTSGNAVVVDVKARVESAETVKEKEKPKPAAEPQPATQPKPAAAPSQSGPLVPVRIGDHPKFNRVVFDWPSLPRYSVSEQPGRAVITFAAPGRIDLEGLRRRLPPELAGLETAGDGKSLVVTVPLPADAHISHFPSGPRVAIDVPRGKPGTVSPSPAPTPAAPALPPSAPPTVSPPTLPVASPPTPLPPVASKTVAVPPVPASPPMPTAEAPLPKLPAAKEPPPPKAAPTMTVSTEEDGSGETAPPGQPNRVISLSFSWNEPAAAAVFRRAGYLWVVFDRPKEMDLSLLRRLGGDVVQAIEQIPSKSATAVRILTRPGFNPSLRREGLLWILDLQRQPLRPKVPIEIKAEPTSSFGPRLFLTVTEGAGTIAVTDPEVGDILQVVPVIPLGHGVYPPHTYPDLELLASAQGIAMAPRSDQVTMQATRTGVEVTAPGGALHLSKDGRRFQAVANLSQDRANTQVFDIGNWRGPENIEYITAKQALEHAVAEVPEANQRNVPRLALARFEFASGRGANALGILQVMASDDPSLLNAAPFRALRGASNFLMYRPEEAVEDLSHPSLAGNDEAAFWRAAAEASLGRPETQIQILRTGGSMLRDYPRPLRVRLAVIGATAAIAAADDLTAQNFIDAAKSDENTDTERAAIGYLTGRYNELTGAYDAAIKNWEMVQDSSSRLYRAKSSLARLELLLRMKRITPAEAIDGMEKLRFAWRGDDFEFTVMKRLGELYMEAGDYGNGLRVFKHMLSAYADNPEAPKITQAMRDAFDRLYLGSAADSLPAITAIALYEEFKELTPSGEKGDEMIRKLADRLVQVDLLDQATPLLETQVRFRLKGVEKAKVGARLALVDLLNRQPQRALDALSLSEMQGVPADLALHRRQLAARALADLGKNPEAVALLNNDTSQDGRLLLAEIYSKNKNWPGVASVMESMVEKPDRGEKLDEQKARWLLNWATALTLAKDERAVARLRRDFLPSLAGSQVYDAFNLLTSSSEGGLLDYRQLGDKLKLAEGFKAFMGNYRERMKKEGLSALY
ncbi:MAG: tetratricopeptide repeat protein [Alphaproteobacteria bacterium]